MPNVPCKKRKNLLNQPIVDQDDVLPPHKKSRGIVGSIISNIGPIECASSICILTKTKSYKSQDPYCKNDKHMDK
jgi:hypothetical protein